MSLGECTDIERLLNEDPNSRWARLDTSPTHYFLINYSQAVGAAPHQWKIIDLYFYTLVGPGSDGPVLVTNCNQLINAVMGGTMFSSLLVNIEHTIESRRRRRVDVGEISKYNSHVPVPCPMIGPTLELETEGGTYD